MLREHNVQYYFVTEKLTLTPAAQDLESQQEEIW